MKYSSGYRDRVSSNSRVFELIHTQRFYLIRYRAFPFMCFLSEMAMGTPYIFILFLVTCQVRAVLFCYASFVFVSSGLGFLFVCCGLVCIVLFVLFCSFVFWFCFALFVCLFLCLSACLCICLIAWLFALLFACFLVCLWQTCLHAHTFIPTSISTQSFSPPL